MLNAILLLETGMLHDRDEVKANILYVIVLSICTWQNSWAKASLLWICPGVSDTHWDLIMIKKCLISS